MADTYAVRGAGPGVVMTGRAVRNLRRFERAEARRSPEAKSARRKKAYEVGKRAFDVAASAAVLVVASPIMGAAAVAIAMEDGGGEPIFAQTRIGKDGKPFTMHKMRTMVKDAEARFEEIAHMNEADGPAFKIKDDPRITKVGRFLRKSSLDELPQFWDVLRGDMSIVGPRPPLPKEVERYEPEWRGKFAVKPGITCFWQVTTDRNDVPFAQWMEMDLRYVREASFMTDLKIMLKTAGAMAKMGGR